MALDNALHDIAQAGFGYPVKNLSALAFIAQQSPVLEDTQMLTHHMAWNLTGLGKLPHRPFALQEELDYAQADGMGNGSQALGRPLQNFVCRAIFLNEFDKVFHNKESMHREFLTCHSMVANTTLCHYIVTSRHVNIKIINTTLCYNFVMPMANSLQPPKNWWRRKMADLWGYGGIANGRSA